jgi:DNA-binding GntR family transcriptional regulator
LAIIARQRATAAYREIRELIVSGRLPPGARVIEMDLARRLGFSRTPIRAALRVLLNERYVLAAGGGGRRRLVVAPLNVADAREVFELVGAIEGLGARLAAALPARQRQRLAAELRGFDEALLAAAAQDPADSVEIFDLFTRFHRRYVEAAAGPRLRALHDSIKPQAERYRRLYSGEPSAGRVGASVVEHASIIAAIEAKDGEGARLAVERNWQNAAERLADLIDDAGVPPARVDGALPPSLAALIRESS